MTTAVVGDASHPIPNKDTLSPISTTINATDNASDAVLNGTGSVKTTGDLLESPDSAIGSTPPTSTPDQDLPPTAINSSSNKESAGGGKKVSVGEGEKNEDNKNTDREDTIGESSDEEGYEEDDEGGMEEEELSEEEEVEQVISASMQFPLAKRALEVSPPSSPDLEGGTEGEGGNAGVKVRVKRDVGLRPVLVEANPSGCESDIEDNDEEEEEEDRKIEKKEGEENQKEEKEEKEKDNERTKDKNTPAIHLPDTVTRLDTPEGAAVYVVGTAHFSRQSQEDVATTIRSVRPDVVVVELCKARTAILQLDEDTILNESRSLDFRKVLMIMRQHGKIQGVLYLLLLSASAHITKQLGMAPGGEFRTAFAEARQWVPDCVIQLGDRPIQVTLSRALASLSLWHKIKLTWHILTSKEPISKEEVERCKQRDFILEMLAEMTGQFPAISEVFVKERDLYLCRSLQLAASIPTPRSTMQRGQSPRVVVGVVGLGHVPGIVERWGTVTDEDISAIMRIPSPTLSNQLLKFGLRVSLYGLVGYGLYRCLPRSAQATLSSTLTSSISSITSLFPASLLGKK